MSKLETVRNLSDTPAPPLAPPLWAEAIQRTLDEMQQAQQASSAPELRQAMAALEQMLQSLPSTIAAELNKALEVNRLRQDLTGKATVEAIERALGPTVQIAPALAKCAELQQETQAAVTDTANAAARLNQTAEEIRSNNTIWDRLLPPLLVALAVGGALFLVEMITPPQPQLSAETVQMLNQAATTWSNAPATPSKPSKQRR